MEDSLHPAQPPTASRGGPRDPALDAALERVRQLEHEVEHLHRLATLGTLASSIAHEFNNFLTPVLSYAQLALAAPTDQDLVRKALTKAVECTQRASQSCSAMLGFVREDEPEPCTHLLAAVSDALACVARDPARDGVELKISISPDCWIHMRPVAVQQVLLNLILNAREAMRGRRGLLVIEAKTCSPWNISQSSRPTSNRSREDDWVELIISDNGKGMSQDLVAKVFEPFVRHSHPEGRRGTGLGLTIIKRLVDAAGGRIHVESTLGKGTTFRMTLPRAAAPAIASAA